jgi:hypothetical protein
MALLGETQVTSEQQSVTEFKDAIAPEQVTALIDSYSEPSDDLTSLKRLLAKPRKVRSFTINALKPSLFTWDTDFNNFFLINSISTKLFNYAGIRFTMCARVSVNTTPFDSGYVTLFHTPPGMRQKTGTLHTREVFMKLPHADLDLGEATATELRVPFYSPLRFLETSKVQTPNYLGYFHIGDPYSTVFAGNSTIVNLYFWLEDVELLYPTNISGTAFRVWTPQGPESRTPSGVNIVLNKDKIDNNYHVTSQAIPYALNLVTKTYKTGSVQTFNELFQTEDFLKGITLTKSNNLTAIQMPVGPCMGDNQYSRLGSISDFFYLYSGSIDIHLKLVKTKFHSGRLQIAFLPLWDPVTPIPASWDDFWNIIWDFSEDSTISFKIPYLSNKFMTMTQRQGGTPLKDYTQGVLAFRQITPLQCPDNVKQDIFLIITGEAGDDLQLAAPVLGTRVSPVVTRVDKLEYSDSIHIPNVVDAVQREQELRESWLGPDSVNEESEPVWEPQGPPSIADKPIPTPENFVNEGTCTLSEFCQKPFINDRLYPFSIQGGIIFPATLIYPRHEFSEGTPLDITLSNLTILAGMFEFYRGDLVDFKHAANAPNYYMNVTGVPLNDGDLLTVPYLSNLKYNSVMPITDATLPVFDHRIRLQNAEFFLPWYSAAHALYE